MSTQEAIEGRQEQETRAVEREIEIEAPVAAVWKAITDAEELTRWFPLDAGVTPGVGGSIWMTWTEGKGQAVPIEIWEPERHLRTGAPAGAAPQIATDFYLEGRGGGTVLRVVSSGFGVEDEWDELYAAWARGWDFELRGLRHYMERHLGERRLVAVANTPYTCSDDEAWARVVQAEGWFGPGFSTPSRVERGIRFAPRSAGRSKESSTCGSHRGSSLERRRLGMMDG